MKLFYSPGACSLGIHILLEEAGAKFGLVSINVRQGEQFDPAFLRVNPKGKVPVLQLEDESVLTEFPAIAFWIANLFPDARLLPATTEGQARVIELVDFVVSTIHMRGFSLAMMPQKFVSDPAAQAEMRAYGLRVLVEGLDRLSDTLQEKEWFLGAYTIADAAVFYVLNWVMKSDLHLAPNLVLFNERMRSRPAVQKALVQEGLA